MAWNLAHDILFKIVRKKEQVCNDQIQCWFLMMERNMGLNDLVHQPIQGRSAASADLGPSH